MSLWGSTDQANNSPIFAPALFKQTPNTANRDALFGNTTANNVGTGETVAVLGVSAGELSYTGTVGELYSVSVSATGAGYTNVIAVTVNDSGNTSANGTATVTARMRVVGASIGGGGNNYVPGDILSPSDGTAVSSNVATVNVVTTNVRSLAIVAAGSGYTNNDAVTITGGTGTSATANVQTNGSGNVTSIAVLTGGVYTANPNTTTSNTTGGTGTGLTVSIVTRLESVAVVNGGLYSALPTLTNNPVTGGSGTTANVTLIMGLGGFNIANNGAGYETPVVALSGAGASNAEATAIALNSDLAGGVDTTHTGWVVRREGTGGRAGRVQYEVLVAGGISGDGSDDSILPE